ncbi:hypothetical protein V8J88_13400 [Massilia sp. W12]|uniref:hypothetical protein n=1 Tax=Massilia sp. W12 TaxID=3126507 RepID=UPI0030D06EC6
MQFKKNIFAAALFAFAAAAQADTVIFSQDYSAQGPINTWVAQQNNFVSAATQATLNFQIRGFNSLDGDNYYIDIFNLHLNGAKIFSGTWNLGGGGLDRVFTSPTGATVQHTGQLVTISLPVQLQAGANNITYSYDSPSSFEGQQRYGWQDLNDEGWQLGAVSVTTAVPEAEQSALILGGLGMLALFARRRKANVVQA